MRRVGVCGVWTLALASAAVAATVVLAGCSKSGTQAASGGTSASGGAVKGESDVVTVKWFNARPVDGPTIQTIHEIADKYSEEKGGKWKLELETTADRPSYLQKLKTLISGGNMPDIFDTDADPYCQELVDAGMLVDVKKFLNDNGMYDKFYTPALRYQEFTNGSLYTLPIEYSLEMTWYNKEIFSQYGLNPPTSLDDWLAICKTLKDNGVTPIAVDGVDRWPVQRYIAYAPFRMTGNGYIIDLATGKKPLSDPTGMAGVNYAAEIGKYFEEGFAATDYSTAQSMFLGGKAAMYGIGSWEIASLEGPYSEGKIDYFYLPAMEGAMTGPHQVSGNSGIGMAFNAKTFDAKTKDFVLYMIENYGKIYTAKQQMSPIKADLPDDVEFTPLYRKIYDDMQNVEGDFLKPWDTYLNADVNSVMQDNLLLLCSGDMSAKDFCQMVDDSIASNQ